jgi:hypothetical protein
MTVQTKKEFPMWKRYVLELTHIVYNNVLREGELEQYNTRDVQRFALYDEVCQSNIMLRGT